jgi:hypothetical protein
MSTHCTIAMKREDGAYISIYCHSDGYPKHTGKILFEHYSDPARVQSLIDLGDISFLAPEIDPPAGVKHSFQERVPGVTVAYHRDRGERKCIDVSNNRMDVPDNEYIYIFEDGEWLLGSLKLSEYFKSNE